jgi:hypothetical protein
VEPRGHDAEHDQAADDAGHEEPSPSPPTNPDEIDRVALAREFAQLLQEGTPSAD